MWFFEIFWKEWRKSKVFYQIFDWIDIKNRFSTWSWYWMNLDVGSFVLISSLLLEWQTTTSQISLGSDTFWYYKIYQISLFFHSFYQVHPHIQRFSRVNFEKSIIQMKVILILGDSRKYEWWDNFPDFHSIGTSQRSVGFGFWLFVTENEATNVSLTLTCRYWRQMMVKCFLI